MIFFYLTDDCACVEKENQFGEGATCQEYTGYVDEWFNGLWCYANISTCKDANEHPEKEDNLKEYGASRMACHSGRKKFKKIIRYNFSLNVFDILIRNKF